MSRAFFTFPQFTGAELVTEKDLLGVPGALLLSRELYPWKDM
jgi:hypothetical protein